MKTNNNNTHRAWGFGHGVSNWNRKWVSGYGICHRAWDLSSDIGFIGHGIFDIGFIGHRIYWTWNLSSDMGFLIGHGICHWTWVLLDIGHRISEIGFWA